MTKCCDYPVNSCAFNVCVIGSYCEVEPNKEKAPTIDSKCLNVDFLSSNLQFVPCAK